jgi:hypothetical protein
MKLTSLLLSSAAVLVAGSAFAADLPAKKAAPAAAVASCPAQGAGYFTIPGSDTCLLIGGRMRYSGTFSNDDQSYTNAGSYLLKFTARSNTEIGLLHGFASMGNDGIDDAYLQFSGFTFGKSSSIADIAGTSAENFGSGLGGASDIGITYAATMGDITLSLGIAEGADNNNTTTTTTTAPSGTPDMLVGISAKAGPVDVKLAAASHVATDATGDTNGYAVVGRVGASMGGGFGVALFGGMSNAAADYTGELLPDTDGLGNENQASNFGGEITVALGKGTLALAAARQSNKLDADEMSMDVVGLTYIYQITKGLTIEPEIVYAVTDDNGVETESSSVFLRVQRDF